jgi:hypothetical protein
MSGNELNEVISKDIDKEIEFYRGIQVFISAVLVIIILIIIFVLFESGKYKYVHIAYVVVTLIISVVIIIEYFDNIIRTLKSKKNVLKSDDNRLGMDKIIIDLNSYFDEIKKEIVYRDNKYTNIIEDNNEKINELMEILFNPNNKFINNIYNSDISNLRNFYILIKNNNYTMGNIYELKNSELYKKCIKTIHHKIFLYNIHQTEFIKILYEFIENVDFNNVEDPINITKFELLANYKILINNIYEDLKVNSTYSDINKKGYINNLKFNKIYSNFSIDNLKNKIDNISNINTKINKLHKNYDHLIRYEFNKYKNIEKYYKILKNYIITMSVLFLIGLIVDYNNNQNNNDNILIIITRFLSNVVLVVFFNVLIISKYNKYKVKNNYSEKLYDLNKEKFENLLINDDNSYQNNLRIIKDLQKFLSRTTRDEPISIKEYDIIRYNSSTSILNIQTNNYKQSQNDSKFYYYNSDRDILLDDEELLYTHILELYKNNINLINHYECCSYINNYKKEVIFPWDEISINVIIFMIIIVVIGTIYKTNGEYNIFEKLQILRETKLKQIGSGDGSGDGSSSQSLSPNNKSNVDLTDSEFIKNMVIIYVFGFYSYRIFSSSLTYYKNYEYIN